MNIHSKLLLIVIEQIFINFFCLLIFLNVDILYTIKLHFAGCVKSYYQVIMEKVTNIILYLDEKGYTIINVI